jgi:hypothetical protein
MARGEATGKEPKQKQTRDRGLPTHTFTVQEFCDAYRISKSRYYELKAQGLTPVEMHVGRKRLISFEAADLWRRQRERAVAA